MFQDGSIGDALNMYVLIADGRHFYFGRTESLCTSAVGLDGLSLYPFPLRQVYAAHARALFVG